jgi:hypothetical protein
MPEASGTSDLRYPIGEFEAPSTISREERARFIQQIEELPGRLRRAVADLTSTQLDTPYRPGGWTLRQVVHHLPDSHMNGYVRFKLALTEDDPIIKPYQEDRWAELEDGRTSPVEVSLAFVEPLHRRWVLMLRGMSDDDFARTFRHPESGTKRLDTYLALYAWHCLHHVAHITALRERMGWR